MSENISRTRNSCVIPSTWSWSPDWDEDCLNDSELLGQGEEILNSPIYPNEEDAGKITCWGNT